MPTENLFLDIQADAELMSFSGASTSSSTVQGLGSLSGKAIMAVGSLVIRVLDSILTRLRLRSIAAQVQGTGTTFSRATFEKLFELQRIGLYPKSVTKKAWALILRLFEMGNSSLIADVLLTGSRVETELFVRQLAAYKLSNWSTEDVPHTPTPRLDANLCKLLNTLLKENPTLLHSIFDLETFLTLLFKGEVCQQYELDTLPYDWWLDLEAPGSWKAPSESSSLLCVARFLATGPRSELEDLIRRLVDKLGSLQKDNPPLNLVSDDFKSTLLFSELLSQISSDASPLLVDAGILRTFATTYECLLSPSGISYTGVSSCRTVLKLTATLMVRLLVGSWEQISSSTQCLHAFADLCPLLLNQIVPSMGDEDEKVLLTDLIMDHLLTLIADRYFDIIDNVGLALWCEFISQCGSLTTSELSRHLVRQPADYILRIMQTLNQYKRSDWSGDTIMLQAIPSAKCAYMHTKFRDLVINMTIEIPETIVNLFTVQEFVHLLTEDSVEEECPVAVPHFFAYLTRISTPIGSQSYRTTEVTLLSMAFARYISSTTLMDRELVVDHLSRSLYAAYKEPSPAAVQCPHWAESFDESSRSIPILLDFAQRLGLENLDTSKLLLENDFIDLLKFIWLANDKASTLELWDDDVSIGILSMVGALTFYDEVERSMMDSGLGTWLKFTSLPFEDASTSKLLEYPLIQRLLLSVLRRSLLHSQQIDNEARQWASVIYILSQSDVRQDDSLMQETVNVLLCGCFCAERWEPLVTGLQSCPYSRLRPALRTVVEQITHLTILSSQAIALRTFVDDLRVESEDDGKMAREETNPIHRFIQLVFVATEKDIHVADAFLYAGMIRILDSVMKGNYDLFGFPVVLNDDLEPIHIRTCMELRERLTCIAHGAGAGEE